jgi:hypothetical protein
MVSLQPALLARLAAVMMTVLLLPMQQHLLAQQLPPSAVCSERRGPAQLNWLVQLSYWK